MSRLSPLPQIMLAPNGARRTKADHPNLPITIQETVASAKAAFEVGAQALHAHVRDIAGTHTLDPGAYRELIQEMARSVPDMPVQVTSEAGGLFSPADQRHMVAQVKPEGVSVALREMWPESATDAAARGFYFDCSEQGIAVQHILYSPADLTRLHHLVRSGQLPQPLQVLCVLGSYATAADAQPDMLTPYLRGLEQFDRPVDWAVCAFGKAETACLRYAQDQAGKVRIGFENNLYQSDGTVARDNAARVSELMRIPA